MKASHFSPDIQEFIRLLSINKVRYVIVGGEAVIYYGYARLTGDVGFFYEVSSENVKKLYKTLESFWGGSVPGIKSQKELLKIGTIFQFGKPPNRIDLLTTINAVTYENAWATRTKEEIKIKDKKYPVYYIGLVELIKNKKSIKRYKDREDLKYLNALKKNK